MAQRQGVLEAKMLDCARRAAVEWEAWAKIDLLRLRLASKYFHLLLSPTSTLAAQTSRPL